MQYRIESLLSEHNSEHPTMENALKAIATLYDDLGDSETASPAASHSWSYISHYFCLERDNQCICSKPIVATVWEKVCKTNH